MLEGLYFMDPTIILKNLPLDITEDDCVTLFRNLGAIHSHLLSRHNRMCAIARCVSLQHAEKLIGVLHQKVLLGRRLSVEFFESQTTQDCIDVPKKDTPNLSNETETVLETSQSENILPVIAPLWDSSARFSSLPRFQYPEINTSIMTNIVRCMFSCPALYTQVLHLMNRLHLPPPFGDCELFPGTHIVCCQSDLAELLNSSFSSSGENNPEKSLAEAQDEVTMDMSSETESELGSDDESGATSNVKSSKQLSMALRNRRKKPRLVVKDHVKAILAGILRKAATKSQKKADSNHVGLGELFESAEAPKQIKLLSLNLPTSLPFSESSECSENIINRNTDILQSVSSEQTFGHFGLLYSAPKDNINDSLQLDSNTKEEKWTEQNPAVSAASPLALSSETDLTASFQLRKDRSSKQRIGPAAAEFSCIEPVQLENQSTSLVPTVFSDKTEHDHSVSNVIGGISTKSLTELAAERLSLSERQNYSVFCRGYIRGEPTSRLYVKNLSTCVTETDLHRIFGLFHRGIISNPDYRTVVWPDRESTQEDGRYSIRLLTQGRMKGQAFVSLASEEIASQALEATNGLLLHDRPMVVQFGRGAKAKVDEKSLIGHV